jgi:group I intron endonuclease
MADSSLAGSGIYQIRNVVNGKLYVGSAVCIEKRWSQHWRRLASKRHDNPRLQSAWYSYGPALFEFSVLEFVQDKSTLIAREHHWIYWLLSATDDGYNLRPRAGSSLGVHPSAESRAKNSTTNTGRKWTDEHRANQAAANQRPERRAQMSVVHKGKPKSAEHRRKIGAAHAGKKYSAEQRANMSAARIGKKANFSTEALRRISEAHKGKSKSLETRARMRAAWALRRASKRSSVNG